MDKDQVLSDQSVLIETRKIKAIAAFILADLMGVMVRGNWYRAAELKALLQNVAAKYNEAVNPHARRITARQLRIRLGIRDRQHY